MLAPDVDTSEVAMQSGIDAARAVTQNSQAVITLVPAYFATLTGKWESMRPALQGVVNDAELWPDTLCAAYTGGVPNLFVAFSATFQQSATTLLGYVDTLESEPSDASSKAALVQGLNTLTNQLQVLQGPMVTLQGQLTAFQSTLQSDWSTLDGLVSDLSENEPGAGTVIESLSASLNVTFYTSSMLSPCVAIVMIDATTQSQIKSALGSQPEVVPAVMERALLSALVTQNQIATSAMSTILDEWSTLISKYQSVANALQAAEGAPSLILEELDIETAQVAWSQLASFAQALTSST